MSDSPKKPPELGRAIQRGRNAGAHLAARVNPTYFVSDNQVADALALLGEAERRLRDESPLWEREWVAMAARGARLAIGRRPEHQATLERCQVLDRRLSALDAASFDPLRARLAEGAYGPADLLRDLEGRPSVEWDAFVNRLFEIKSTPEAETERPEHMVLYVASPVPSILELGARLGPEDVLYDVGSGMGLVTLLIAWQSGARTKGLEREPAYHREACALAARFPTLQVEPLLIDARQQDYGDATVVYIYDSIRDRLLEELLARVEATALRPELQVVSRGKSTPTVASASWLECTETSPTGLSYFRRRD